MHHKWKRSAGGMEPCPSRSSSFSFPLFISPPLHLCVFAVLGSPTPRLDRAFGERCELPQRVRMEPG